MNASTASYTIIRRNPRIAVFRSLAKSLRVCVERRGRESNPQVPLDTVIYKITGLASCPTSPHKKLVRRMGIEPTAFGLAGRRSIGYPRVPVEGASRLASPLSYRRTGTKHTTPLTMGNR